MAWRRPGDKPYLNQWWLVYWRIYASLGLNELTHSYWWPIVVYFLMKLKFQDLTNKASQEVELEQP